MCGGVAHLKGTFREPWSGVGPSKRREQVLVEQKKEKYGAR